MKTPGLPEEKQSAADTAAYTKIGAADSLADAIKTSLIAG